jgi:hypothetical protein
MNTVAQHSLVEGFTQSKSGLNRLANTGRLNYAKYLLLSV